MNDLFISTFLSVFQGLAKIFIIGLVAGLLVWKKILSQQHVDALSKITVYFFLPCLIFSTIFSNFNPEDLPLELAVAVADDGPVLGQHLVQLGHAEAPGVDDGGEGVRKVALVGVEGKVPAGPIAGELGHLYVSLKASIQPLGQDVVHLLVEGEDMANARCSWRLVPLIVLEHNLEVEVPASILYFFGSG